MTAAWAVPSVAIVLTQVAVIATSIYLHRALAHRSLHLHPIADLGFRIALWLTTGQSRQQWVAVHRKHHTFTDRPGDPHSPLLLGFWRVQLFNVAYYVREARNAKTLEAFAPDLRPDRLDRLFFSRGVLGLMVGLSLLCMLIGLWPGLIAGLHARGPLCLRDGAAHQSHSATGAAPRTSRTPPTTCVSWPGLPGARVFITIITLTPDPRNSACAGRSSILRGRSSGHWRRWACSSSRGRRSRGRASERAGGRHERPRRLQMNERAEMATEAGTPDFPWPDFDRWQATFAAAQVFPARWRASTESLRRTPLKRRRTGSANSSCMPSGSICLTAAPTCARTSPSGDRARVARQDMRLPCPACDPSMRAKWGPSSRRCRPFIRAAAACSWRYP